MTYRILVLSGGGVRGVFQARFLVEAEKWLDEKPLAKNFDLIAGTSTGGIIALALALQIPAAEIFEFYMQLAEQVFPQSTYRFGQKQRSYLFRGPLYDNKPLEAALKQVFTRDGRSLRLDDCVPPVVIPATYLNEYKTRIFTSVQSQNGNAAAKPASRNSNDGGLRAVDVAMATTAAPLFFSAFKASAKNDGAPGQDPDETCVVDTGEYVDGGLWANNPALTAVMIANRDRDIPFEDMRVISIGNGESPSGTVAMNYNRMRRLKMLRPTLDMMFSTQAEMAEAHVAMLIKHKDGGTERLLRINTPMQNLVALDDVGRAKAELPGRAEAAARLYRDRFVTLARNDPKPSDTRCGLGRSAIVEVSRFDDGDTSDLFYIFVVVTPVRYLADVRKTFENWEQKLRDGDEPNNIEVIGVYDVYGTDDIVVCARAAAASCETVKKHVQDQLRLRNPDVEQSEGELRIRDVRKEYLVRQLARNDVEVRALRAFCEIELPIHTTPYAARMLTRLQATTETIKGARLIAFNWCVTHLVAEFYVACGGYYELSSIIRSIETHVAPDARGKTTWLSFSAWERPSHQRVLRLARQA